MNTSFRTRLFFSYFLLILMAAGIVDFVSVSQIRGIEQLDFETDLIDHTDEARDELEDALIEASEKWMCDLAGDLTPAEREELEGLFGDLFEEEGFDCSEVPIEECWFIAEQLELDEVLESDEGDEDDLFFCNQIYDTFETELVQQDFGQIVTTENRKFENLIVWDIRGEQVLFEFGDGPSDDPQIRNLLGESDSDVMTEPIEYLETAAEFVYVGRVVGLIDDPYLYVLAGQSSAGIESATRGQALEIAAYTGLAGLVLLFILGSWMANTLASPITELRTSAQAMAAGRLEARISGEANTTAPPEIRALAEDFNTMAAAVEAMVAEQRAFANNAAHELRTPLTAVRIRTEALLEDEPDAQMQQTYISDIHDEIGRLSRLVEDLRTLSRADARNMEAGNEEVNLVNLVRALQREFGRQIGEKGLTVELESPELFVVRAGATHMRTALRNVLENAIKYNTARGTITISLRTTHYADGSFHEIKVQDTGIGIPAEDLPHLTKRFYRVDKAHNRNVPGSGLGLSLVSSIVELYGGRLDISSDGVGQGSTVTLLLPAQSESANLCNNRVA